MRVLVELSLFINFALNFFIIKCTSACVGVKAKFAVLASILGGVVALIMPMFNIGKLANIAVQVLLCLSLCFLCFEIKPIKKFLITISVFLGFTFVFGGACLAVENMFGQLPLIAVLGVAVVVYAIARIVIAYQNRIKRMKKFSFKVSLKCKDRVVTADGFLDSGNVLYDPVTKKPIILITYDIFNQLQPDINYMTAYCKQVDVKKLEGGHYVKINTVASGTSILVFNVDKLQIFEGESNRDYNNMAVGLSFSGFDKALGRKILLHRELA